VLAGRSATRTFDLYGRSRQLKESGELQGISDNRCNTEDALVLLLLLVSLDVFLVIGL